MTIKIEGHLALLLLLVQVKPQKLSKTDMWSMPIPECLKNTDFKKYHRWGGGKGQKTTSSLLDQSTTKKYKYKCKGNYDFIIILSQFCSKITKILNYVGKSVKSVGKMCRPVILLRISAKGAANIEDPPPPLKCIWAGSIAVTMLTNPFRSWVFKATLLWIRA